MSKEASRALTYSNKQDFFIRFFVFGQGEFFRPTGGLFVFFLEVQNNKVPLCNISLSLLVSW